MTSTEVREQMLNQVIQSKETILILQVMYHSDEQTVWRTFHSGLVADIMQSCRWQSCSRHTVGEAVLCLSWLGK